MDERNPLKANFQTFNYLIENYPNFLSFFKSQVSFHLNFVSPFSVMTRNSSEFSSWNFTLWTEITHQSTNFQIFECFNENSPNSSCQFWNHKVEVYSIFASLLSVMKYNSSVFFYLKPIYFGQKEPVEVKFSDFSGWVKIQQIPYVMFETTSQFFIKLCITFQCHERYLFCTFLAGTVHDLDQRSSSKCKISDFRLLMWNITKFVLW